MTLLVMLSTTLRPCVPGYDPHRGLLLEAPEGSTPCSVARSLHLPLEDIKIIMVNNRASTMEMLLQDGDRVAFFPPVGGG